MNYHYYKRPKKGKYKGVYVISNCYKKNPRTYIIAKIYFKGKQIFLGSFVTEIKAAIAYNKAALEYFGEDAYVNIIRQN